MRSGLSQAQEQALMRPTPEMMSPAPAFAPTTKEIPYDYVAKFKLLGKQGNRVQDVINISIEGGFVAVAIGYSFIPSPLPKLPEIPIEGTNTVNLVNIIANKIAVELLRENGTNHLNH